MDSGLLTRQKNVSQPLAKRLLSACCPANRIAVQAIVLTLDFTAAENNASLSPNGCKPSVWTRWPQRQWRHAAALITKLDKQALAASRIDSRLAGSLGRPGHSVFVNRLDIYNLD